MKFSFTANQIALLVRYFFDDDGKYDFEYRKICQGVYDLIGLGDPYDKDLIMTFVKSIIPTITSQVLKDESNLVYLVQKCIYWAEEGAKS